MPQYRQLMTNLLTISLISSSLYACGPLPQRSNHEQNVTSGNVRLNKPIPTVTSNTTVDTYSRGNKSARYQKLMSQYHEWHGVPHRDGGDDKRGIDCSAFVERTFVEKFNMRVPGTTKRLKNFGQAVARDELQVGDLVMFKTGAFARHVGIYIGNGKMLHVSSRIGVSIAPIDSGYWNDHYWQSRRVF